MIERHVLSAQQLRIHSDVTHCYPSDVLFTAMLESESTLDVTLCNAITEKQESLVQLILFGSYSTYHQDCSG